jgi:chaperonin GroES
MVTLCFIIKPPSQMQPIGNKILVKELPPETVTKGGIIIPETAKKRPGQATVVFASEDIVPYKKGGRIPKAGDTILMDPECGQPVYYNNAEHLMIVYENVQAIL